MAQTETAAAVMALAPNGFAAFGADDLAVRVPSAAATPAGPGGPPEASADTELGGDARASGESASDNDGSSLPVDNSSGVNVGDSMETDAKRPRSDSGEPSGSCWDSFQERNKTSPDHYWW